MQINYTTQGLLIYLTMVCYLTALFAVLLKYHKAGYLLYTFGFAAAVICFSYRWYHVSHIPMQNLFEVFLFLGVAIYPVSLLCRRISGTSDPGFDIFISILVLFPAAFIFSAEPGHLPPALQSWLFGPHVAVYMISYIFMAKAASLAVRQLAGGKSMTDEKLFELDVAAYHLVCGGFPLMTAGLLLGSYWGQLAWGDYWGWDPKELWSLASWLVYVGYFHFRSMFGKRYPRINSLWVIAGMTLIVVTLLWVNLSKLFIGLHSYAV